MRNSVTGEDDNPGNSCILTAPAGQQRLCPWEKAWAESRVSLYLARRIDRAGEIALERQDSRWDRQVASQTILEEYMPGDFVYRRKSGLSLLLSAG